MDTLSIALHEDKTAFAPRQTVQGTIQWSLQRNPEHLEFSLFWYTSGKGTRDVGVVETARFDNPGSCGSKDFAFTLPDGPYSFSADLADLGRGADVHARRRDRPPGDHAFADGPRDRFERSFGPGRLAVE